MSGVSSTNVSGLSRGLDQILKASGEGTVGATSGFGVTVQSPNFPGISKVESPFSRASREDALNAKLHFSMALKGEFGLSEKVIKYIETKIDIHSDAPLKLSDAKEILSELHVLNQVKNGTLDKSHMQGLKHFTLVPKPKEQVQEAMSYTSRRFAEFGLEKPKGTPDDTTSSFGLVGDDTEKPTVQRQRRGVNDTLERPVGFEPKRGTQSVGSSVVDLPDQTDKDDEITATSGQTDIDVVADGKTEPTPVVPKTTQENLRPPEIDLGKQDVEPQTTIETGSSEVPKEVLPNPDPGAKTNDRPALLSDTNPGLKNFLSGKDTLRPVPSSDKLPGLGIAPKEEAKPKDTGPISIPKSSSEGLSMLVDELRKRDVETGGSR